MKWRQMKWEEDNNGGNDGDERVSALTLSDTHTRSFPNKIFKIACNSAILILNLLEYVMHVKYYFFSTSFLLLVSSFRSFTLSLSHSLSCQSRAKWSKQWMRAFCIHCSKLDPLEAMKRQQLQQNPRKNQTTPTRQYILLPANFIHSMWGFYACAKK